MAVRDVTDMRQGLIDTWNGSSQNIVDDAIDKLHKRLQACVDEKGSHFELLLCHLVSDAKYLCR